MEDIKSFAVSVLSLIIGYFSPVYDYAMIILYLFACNFIIGLIEDIIVKKSRFKIKKFFFCLCEMLVYSLLVGSIFFVGDRFHNRTLAVQCISGVSVLVTYFYSANMLRNLHNLFPKNLVFSFLYYVLSFEIVKKIPYLQDFNNYEHNKNIDKDKESQCRP